MIDYLTHPRYIDYDCNYLPSFQGGGGGMGVKTCRVLEALRDVYPNTRAISNASEIEADIVLIEPLRFTLSAESKESAYEPVDTLIAGLRNSDSKKILYCSEMALMRMLLGLRIRVVSACDAVTTNCQFQSKVFQYAGVYSNYTLCDPIPEIFISQGKYDERKPRIVATGNVSWQKNAPHVIEVFKALKGIIERAYIGSASLWFDASTHPEPMRLQEELYANTDHVIREATQNQVARAFHESKIGLWVAFHDTFATAAQEMLMAGLPVVAARHGLASELPVWGVSGVREQVDAIKKLINESDEALEEQANRISKWAKEHASYETFHDQLKTVLKGVY